jgi:F-type H+-transporting ATPase subunit delta
MKNPKVSYRFAKALLDLARERNVIDAVKADVQIVINALTASEDLRVLCASPVIKPKVKESLMEQIFAKNISDISLKFIQLVIRHRREHNLKEILERYISLYLVEKGIVTATVTTSIALDNELKEEFITMVKGLTNKEVELEEKVDADVIGGYILRVGDMEMNASLSGKLNRLKTEFKDNPYAASI